MKKCRDIGSISRVIMIENKGDKVFSAIIEIVLIVVAVMWCLYALIRLGIYLVGELMK